MKNNFKRIFEKPDNPALAKIKMERKRREEIKKFLEQQKPTSIVSEDYLEKNKKDISGNDLISFNNNDYKISNESINSKNVMERIKKFTRSYLVESNEDRIIIAMTKYKENISKKTELTSKIKTCIMGIVSNIVNVIALLLIIYSSDYKQNQLFSSTISPAQWEIIFIMIIIFYIIFTAVLILKIIYFFIKSLKINEMSLKEFVDILIEEAK